MSQARPIGDLLPHQGAMRLLSDVLHHDETTTTCRASVDANGLFIVDGHLPASVLLEYMAQAACVHANLAAGERKTATLALLLGTREMRLFGDDAAAGTELEVAVTCVLHTGTLASFRCEVRAAPELLATATIQVQMRPIDQ